MTTLNPVAVGATDETTDRPSRHRRGDLAVLLHQIRYEQLSFWRNPQAMIFTFVFPIAFIAIIGAVFGGGEASDFFYGRTGMQYYTATIAAVSVLGACYGQLAIALAARRQTGVLKRLHATPLPAWIYFAGLLAHCLMVSVIDVVLVVSVGALYDAPVPADWASVGVTLLLGSVCYCALGAAVASLVSNSEAAPAVVQFVQFPLVFISGSYFPIHSDTLNTLAGLLPVKPFNDALLSAFTTGDGLHWKQHGILLAWGVLGTLIAVRRFRWDPRPE
ncbi:ABC transporter permease [Micromonospora sp. NPDC005367]|uniref:ABC transporter permease n=1 Tax=Micromonospora sp. NPDC005367 TaxID=3155590 RepID=UPI0033B68FA1